MDIKEELKSAAQRMWDETEVKGREEIAIGDTVEIIAPYDGDLDDTNCGDPKCDKIGKRFVVSCISDYGNYYWDEEDSYFPPFMVKKVEVSERTEKVTPKVGDTVRVVSEWTEEIKNDSDPTNCGWAKAHGTVSVGDTFEITRTSPYGNFYGHPCTYPLPPQVLEVTDSPDKSSCDTEFEVGDWVEIIEEYDSKRDKTGCGGHTHYIGEKFKVTEVDDDGDVLGRGLAINSWRLRKCDPPSEGEMTTFKKGDWAEVVETYDDDKDMTGIGDPAKPVGYRFEVIWVSGDGDIHSEKNVFYPAMLKKIDPPDGDCPYDHDYGDDFDNHDECQYCIKRDECEEGSGDEFKCPKCGDMIDCVNESVSGTRTCYIKRCGSDFEVHDYGDEDTEWQGDYECPNCGRNISKHCR